MFNHIHFCSKKAFNSLIINGLDLIFLTRSHINNVQCVTQTRNARSENTSDDALEKDIIIVAILDSVTF